MPKQYEDIRDSYIKRGTPEKKAKSIAAATYNKNHPGKPMKPDKHAHTKKMLRGGK